MKIETQEIVGVKLFPNYGRIIPIENDTCCFCKSPVYRGKSVILVDTPYKEASLAHLNCYNEKNME